MTALALVMGLGMVVLVGAFVWRLLAPPLPLPDTLDLPEGARATAVTQGSDWVGIVARGADGAEAFLVFDRLTGRLRQEVALR